MQPAQRLLVNCERRNLKLSVGKVKRGIQNSSGDGVPGCSGSGSPGSSGTQFSKFVSRVPVDET
jgi:hypothetical protein